LFHDICEGWQPGTCGLAYFIFSPIICVFINKYNNKKKKKYKCDEILTVSILNIFCILRSWKTFYIVVPVAIYTFYSNGTLIVPTILLLV
jgi:hypothetical protein